MSEDINSKMVDDVDVNPENETTKCGYISILGKPNAGKSTLLNAVVGEKIVGVSRKPQTTRKNLMGIVVRDNCQFLFLDTPGLHRQKQSMLNSYMNKEAWSGVEGCDVALYLIDGLIGISEEDRDYLTQLSMNPNLVLVVGFSKADRLKNFELKKQKKEVEAFFKENHPKDKNPDFKATVVSFSSKVKESVEELLSQVSEFLPENAFQFDPDQLTDKPEKFIVSELIREKLFRLVGEEIPYKTAVIIEKMSFKNKRVYVDAKIVCGQKGHKGIIIGHQGSKIKEIGTESRKQLEQHFSKQVMLNLFVGVDENWFDNHQQILDYENYDQ